MDSRLKAKSQIYIESILCTVNFRRSLTVMSIFHLASNRYLPNQQKQNTPKEPECMLTISKSFHFAHAELFQFRAPSKQHNDLQKQKAMFQVRQQFWTCLREFVGGTA